MADDKLTSGTTTSKTKMDAEAIAKEALHALGREDLLYAHHGDVHARPEAYRRLAEFIIAFGKEDP